MKIFLAVIAVINVTHNYRTAESIYHVPNRKIIQLAKILESTQEQRDTPLVESYNQKQIFRWVSNHPNLTIFQGHGYT